MKLMSIAFCLMFAIQVRANIEYSPAESSKATPNEISQNRACFEELKTDGCGDPSEDNKHFRSCLNNVYPRLTNYCKKMMTELYGNN